MRRNKSLALAIVLSLAAAACGGSAGPAPKTRAAARQAAVVKHRHRVKPRSERVRNATPQPNWRLYASQKVPILVYHDLGTPPASEPYPGLFVSDSDFEAEMAWLHSAGYQGITLDEMMHGLFDHGRLPAKPIVITFDNGYIPQATFAPAVMSKYGWPGVLNEITVGHLSDARLKRLVARGWEVDSHSLTHPDLTVAGSAQLQAEVLQSRRFLQHVLHVPVNSFCYPSNRYNAAVIAAVKAAGYTNAVTENPGFATPQTDPYVLPRFEIEGGLSQLQADLSSHS